MLTLNKNTDIKHLYHFADALGLGTVLFTGYAHITEWLKVYDYNKTVLALTSFFALIFLIQKIYHQRLVNKKLRKESKGRKK